MDNNNKYGGLQEYVPNTQQVNSNDEYIISIVRLNPFRIEDSKVTLNTPANSMGIISFTRNSIYSDGPITAHVVNQTDQHAQPLTFSVDINRTDKVIGFIEDKKDNGPGGDFLSSISFMQRQGNPLNILTFGDLLMNLSQQQQQQYRQPMQYNYRQY